MIELLTPHEAAVRLHIAERTLRDLKRLGKIRYVQLTARKIAYRSDDCDEYIDTRVMRDEPASQSRPGRPQQAGKRRAAQILPFSKQPGGGRKETP